MKTDADGNVLPVDGLDQAALDKELADAGFTFEDEPDDAPTDVTFLADPLTE